jgi:hypothetical protein
MSNGEAKLGACNEYENVAQALFGILGSHNDDHCSRGISIKAKSEKEIIKDGKEDSIICGR